MNHGSISSEPVETPYGFRVTRLDRHIEGHMLPFEAIREKIADYPGGRRVSMGGPSIGLVACRSGGGRGGGKQTAGPTICRRLLLKQTPDYLWIGCSDSRVPANEIVGLDQAEPHRFFRQEAAKRRHKLLVPCCRCTGYPRERPFSSTMRHTYPPPPEADQPRTSDDYQN